jgi:hypothetical protein
MLLCGLSAAKCAGLDKIGSKFSSLEESSKALHFRLGLASNKKPPQGEPKTQI